MAVYQKNKIQEDVRTALDQNMNSDTLKIIGDVDTLALDDIITSKILEAVKRVHSSAPSYFQMNDWERAVFNPINTDDPEYEKQSSRFKGIRGTCQRPVCAISIRPEGRVMEFYSCKTTEAKVSRAVYLPYPKIDKYGAVEICEKCYDAVIYTIAALVLTTFGDTEKSAALNELAKSVLI